MNKIFFVLGRSTPWSRIFPIQIEAIKTTRSEILDGGADELISALIGGGHRADGRIPLRPASYGQ